MPTTYREGLPPVEHDGDTPPAAGPVTRTQTPTPTPAVRAATKQAAKRIKGTSTSRMKTTPRSMKKGTTKKGKK